MSNLKKSLYARYFKRIIDIGLALSAIIFLSPLLASIAFLVRIKLGSPIIFKQRRAGRYEKAFEIYKFRTMTDICDASGVLLPDEKRLTKFGKVLRSSSMDELPELINIIKGDLSIVGPRSLLLEYLPYYTTLERQRHLVRGGLTPPEVLYNNIMPTWEEQFAYEVDYVNNISFLLDCRIILATFKGLLTRNSNDYGGYTRESLIKERQKI